MAVGVNDRAEDGRPSQTFSERMIQFRGTPSRFGHPYAERNGPLIAKVIPGV